MDRARQMGREPLLRRGLHQVDLGDEHALPHELLRARAAPATTCRSGAARSARRCGRSACPTRGSSAPRRRSVKASSSARSPKVKGIASARENAHTHDTSVRDDVQCRSCVMRFCVMQRCVTHWSARGGSAGTSCGVSEVAVVEPRRRDRCDSPRAAGRDPLGLRRAAHDVDALRAAPRGRRPPRHREHTDLFYVLDGTIAVRLGLEDEIHACRPGRWRACRRIVVHGFRNPTTRRCATSVHAPGRQFADYLRAMRDGRPFTYDQHDPPGRRRQSDRRGENRRRRGRGRPARAARGVARRCRRDRDRGGAERPGGASPRRTCTAGTSSPSTCWTAR